ncbi:MAG: hypothetical protein QXU20_01320 [Candidatus Woesearchaeota archaeon]
MNLNLVLIAITNLVVFLIILNIILKSARLRNYKILEFFSFLSIFYFSSFLINITYAFRTTKLSFVEEIIFGTSFITITTPLILFGVYAITKKKVQISFIILYSLIFLLSLKEADSLIVHLTLISYSILILLFINLLKNKFFIKTAFYGIFYSFSSIILVLLMIKKSILGCWFLPNIFLILSYYNLIPIAYEDFSRGEASQKKTSFTIFVLKYAIFITALLFFSFLSTIAVHEIGHALVAKFYNCEAESVIYSKGLTPYTEITCLNNNKPPLLVLAGLFFTIFFSVALMLFGTELMVYLGYILLGISFLIAHSDLGFLGMPNSILITINIFSFFVITIGMFKISEVYIELSGEKNKSINTHNKKS